MSRHTVVRSTVSALVCSFLAVLATAAQAATYVYVSNADSQEIQVSQLNPRNGEMIRLQGVPVHGSVMPMAVSPDHRRLYASLRTAPFSVASFNIDPRTGRLDHIGDFPLPDNMANIATDHSGRLLFAASYSGNKVSVSRIDADGKVEAAHQVIPTGPMAHCILPSPDNKYVFATNLGADVLLQMKLDPKAGTLSPNDPPAVHFPKDSGPRHFRFRPDGRFAYLVDELDAQLHVLAYHAASGTFSEVQTLSAMPPDFNGKPWGSDVHITPDGRFLYAAERTSSTISAYRIDAHSGKLTRIASYPTEKQPRGFNIDPSGRYLVAVGQLSNGMTVYAIDRKHGTLKPVQHYTTAQNPNWVEIVSIGKP